METKTKKTDRELHIADLEDVRAVFDFIDDH